MTAPIRPTTHRHMPPGCIHLDKAAEILNCTAGKVSWLAKNGYIPPAEDLKVDGVPIPCRIWPEAGIRAYAASQGIAQKPKADKKRPTPTALALLERLRHYADAYGTVDGDATDLVCGNPPRWQDLEALDLLVAAKALTCATDRWGRMTFTLAQDWRPR